MGYNACLSFTEVGYFVSQVSEAAVAREPLALSRYFKEGFIVNIRVHFQWSAWVERRETSLQGTGSHYNKVAMVIIREIPS